MAVVVVVVVAVVPAVVVAGSVTAAGRSATGGSSDGRREARLQVEDEVLERLRGQRVVGAKGRDVACPSARRP